MKRLRDKLQHIRQRLPPVAPAMPAISDAELMRDLPLPHGDVNQGISLVQKVVIAAVDVPADGLDVIYWYSLDQ